MCKIQIEKPFRFMSSTIIWINFLLLMACNASSSENNVPQENNKISTNNPVCLEYQKYYFDPEKGFESWHTLVIDFIANEIYLSEPKNYKFEKDIIIAKDDSILKHILKNETMSTLKNLVESIDFDKEANKSKHLSHGNDHLLMIKSMNSSGNIKFNTIICMNPKNQSFKYNLLINNLNSLYDSITLLNREKFILSLSNDHVQLEDFGLIDNVIPTEFRCREIFK